MATDYKKYILSTGTHYISNSGGDEKGGIKGGKAGDQKSEWVLKKWYNRPWNHILRYPDINVGTLIAQMGIDAALNNHIGYDQGQRTTYWTQLKKVGYYPAKITVNCEEDCSAGVSSNVKGAGFLLGIKALQNVPICSSRNMLSEFKKAGFKDLTDSKYTKGYQYLLPGDILLYTNHHAATNVSKGKNVSYTYVNVIGDVAKYAGTTPHDDSLRPGSTGSAVKSMQKLLLLHDPKCLPKYGADGDYGSETEAAVKSFQKSVGLPVTGICDKITLHALDNLPINVVATGDVNVRTAPGAHAQKIGVLLKGQTAPYQMQVKYVDTTPWYLVMFDGENGWVSGKYAKLEVK